MLDQNITSFFDKLYDETYDQVLFLVGRKFSNVHDIEDIMQETYAEVYAVLLKKGIAYIQEPVAFTKKIARRKIFKHYSYKEKVKNLLFSFSLQDHPIGLEAVSIQSHEMIDEAMINKVMIDEISAILSGKSEEIQQIFFMYYSLDMTSTQIAMTLSLNESTVKSKLHRTLKELRMIYQKEGL